VGGTVQLTNSAGTGRSILFTPSLSVTGKLDLTNNDLVVENGNLATITSMLHQGLITGSGIISSSASFASPRNTALGVILNTVDGVTPLYGSGTALGLFDGTSPSPDDVLVKYTYDGDTNLDGKVDGTDYARIDNGYLQHLTGWYNGDFNYDGIINGSNYTLIDNAFNTQGSTLQASFTTAMVTTSLAASPAVPEPTSLAAFSSIAPFLLRRRRRAPLLLS
jgi:hypothetical protein